MATQSDAHGHFMLLLRVSGFKGGDAELDRLAQSIHNDFMEAFGAVGAITMLLLRLKRLIGAGTNVHNATEWTHVVSYFGPESSVKWLQQRLESVAHENGATVETTTFSAQDITGRY